MARALILFRHKENPDAASDVGDQINPNFNASSINCSTGSDLGKIKDILW